MLGGILSVIKMVSPVSPAKLTIGLTCIKLALILLTPDEKDEECKLQLTKKKSKKPLKPM